MKKLAILFLNFTILLLIGSTCISGQVKETALKDKQITIQMTQKPLYTVFMRMIQKYDIAVGFEESALDRNHRHYYFEPNIATDKLKAELSSDKEFLPGVSKFNEHLITVNFKQVKLENVLDSIVGQMTNYSWEIKNEVVNIFPTSGRDTRLEKLLNVKGQFLGVGAGADINSIQAQLMLFLPEFKSFLKENNLKFRTDRQGSIFLDRVLPDGMSFHDMSFKELLNAITKSKRGGWILQIKNDGDNPEQEFVEIDI